MMLKNRENSSTVIETRALVASEQWGGGTDCKGPDGIFLGKEMFYILIGLCFCQNYKCTFKICGFYDVQIILNKSFCNVKITEKIKSIMMKDFLENSLRVTI